MKATSKDNAITLDALKNILTILSLCIAVASFVFAASSKGDNKLYEYRPIIVTDYTRALNTAYQVSSSRYTIVAGSNTISSSLSLSGGQSGTVTLQVSKDNGVTDPYTAKQTSTNNNTGALTLGLSTVQAQAGELSYTLQPGYWYKFVSAGASTFGILPVQETNL